MQFLKAKSVISLMSGIRTRLHTPRHQIWDIACRRARCKLQPKRIKREKEIISANWAIRWLDTLLLAPLVCIKAEGFCLNRTSLFELFVIFGSTHCLVNDNFQSKIKQTPSDNRYLLVWFSSVAQLHHLRITIVIVVRQFAEDSLRIRLGQSDTVQSEVETVLQTYKRYMWHTG